MQITDTNWYLLCDDGEQKQYLFDHARECGVPLVEEDSTTEGGLAIGIGQLSRKLMCWGERARQEGERIDQDKFYDLCDEYAEAQSNVAPAT